MICYASGGGDANSEYRTASTTANSNGKNANKKFRHTMAILAMPGSIMDRILNEAVLETVLPQTNKLSVVLRCCDGEAPSIASLRRYVGEIYSQLWDCSIGEGGNEDEEAGSVSNTVDFRDVVVYPQNLPNAAPEAWLDIQKDLDCVCSHDGIVGWTSELCDITGSGADGTGHSASRGQRYLSVAGEGMGGLREHCQAMNMERKQRGLKPVRALIVNAFPNTAGGLAFASSSNDNNNHLIFLDDEEDDDRQSELNLVRDLSVNKNNYYSSSMQQRINDNNEEDENEDLSFLSGARISSQKSQHLYDSVAVGGTFDGMHFGHRKLLTLAVSSVKPITGRLLVGVTVDKMLKHKNYGEYIPTFQQRCEGVRKFLDRLAPGMIDRVELSPISDKFGLPGKRPIDNQRVGVRQRSFDALVLSHETLETGFQLNAHRQQIGLEPLKLLCTRRTEAHGMSSTTLRRLRKHKMEQQQRQSGQRRAQGGDNDDDDSKNDTTSSKTLPRSARTV